MINEGFDILNEGVAASPTDIDLVLVHGYGYPRWRGGLMHTAYAYRPDRGFGQGPPIRSRGSSALVAKPAAGTLG